MTITKTTRSEQTGTLLIDRDCVILDGKCDCMIPVFENCKYLKFPKECFYKEKKSND